MKRTLLILSGLLACLAVYSQDNAGGGWWQSILNEARAASEAKADSTSKKTGAGPAVTPAAPVVPVTPAAPVAPAAPAVPAAAGLVAAVEADEAGPAPAADTAVVTPKINLCLLLPFNAAGEPNYRAFDFYSGVLMAVMNAGNDADSVSLKVFDSANGVNSVSKQTILSSDIVMGPFAADDIRKLADRYGKFVISPLEPSGSTLTSASPVIQAPTPWKEQVRELVRWAGEYNPEKEKLVVVSNSEKNEACREEVLYQLGCSETKYEEISCASYENLQEIIGNAAAEGMGTRFIIASEEAEFSRRIISVIGSLAEKGKEVSTFCTTKARTYSMPATDRGKAKLKITAAYFVDDSDPAVRTFEREYTEKFGSRPNSFAYQGYDLTNYFISAYKAYGKDWQRYITEFAMEGLQTDFAFDVSGIGYENCGIRRIEYNPDGTSGRVR